MYLFNNSVTILLVFYISGGQSTHEWFGQKWLDENYLFKWKTNQLEKVITFRVEVITKGCVTFGLSKHGKTTEVDVVIGCVDDWGHSTFNDYWVNKLGNISLDNSQDWALLSAEENATHTVLEFRRHYVTCDETNDVEIFENDFEVSNIIFGYCFSDNNYIKTIDQNIDQTNVIKQVIYMNLFEIPEVFDPKETDIESIDHWFNISVAPRSSGIFCKLQKMEFMEKRQIIKFHPITHPSIEEMKLNHHLLWLDCQKLSDADDLVNLIFPCYETKNSSAMLRQHCAVMKFGAVLNNEQFTYPDNTGLVLDPVQNPYFLLESHVINPTDNLINAEQSLRIWLTKQMRQTEARFTAFHSTHGNLYSTWGFIIPPKQPDFITSFVTSTYCLENDQFDEKGIFIFRLFLHSHQGIQMELRQYRNDKLIRVLQHRNYNALWQPFRLLKVPINLRKTDKLVAFCDFDSTHLTESYTSPNEHCVAGIHYYPAISIPDEHSYYSRIPYETMLKITGLVQIDGYETDLKENIIIRKPVKYNNTKLIDFISDNKYKINDPKELEELQISEDMMECCFDADKEYEKIKPCRLIKKPPGLYKSVMQRRKQNTCPYDQHLKEDKLKAKPKTENKC